MTRFFLTVSVALIAIAGQVQAQSVYITPDRLREGDGKTRNVTVVASSVARLSIAVTYSSSPGSSNVDFISRFVVQDNGSEDRNPQDGNIRLVLPKAFDKTGVYTITIDDTHSIKLVHEANNSSYFRQFIDYLVGAAGGGVRKSNPKSGLERIADAIKTGEQNKLAIWTAPMPAAGQQIDQQSPTLSVGSAVMPSWSPKGNSIACSAWRNGKWIIAAYTIRQTGQSTQLWQWSPRNGKTSDFSPAWSPSGDAVAFVRLNEDQRSDVWILELDKSYRPKREVKVTNLGNVQAVLGWDKDLGILFETKTGQSSSSDIWASKATTAMPDNSPIPLSDVYSFVRGSAPLRQSVVYTQENESSPVSVVYEVSSNGKRATLLIGDSCSYRWPSVSPDEKWLVFDFDCPH
jgi:hypothetical protein